MTIKQFDKPTAKLIGQELEAAAQAIAKKHGLQVRHAGGQFMAGSYIAKTEFAVIGEDGIAITKEVEAFKTLAASYGFKPEDLGREFRSGGRTFKLSGITPGSAVRPILATCEGKTYKFPTKAVIAALAA